MKRLVVCCDGTWNNPEKEHVTNVVKTARAILPVDKEGVVQEVFYDWGVGSYYNKTGGGISGKGIEKNIRDGYRFLVHNFDKGDQIYLFGYSRGAYTARSLAGFIRNCGILKKEHANRIAGAFELYRNRKEHPSQKKSNDFRKQFSLQPDIAFIGVWDTVGSLGIPLWILRKYNLNKYKFHDTSLSKIIKYACHALAVDEVRKDFEPTLWKNSPQEDQTIAQAWFAGTHGDIGGGHAQSGLSDITLRWIAGHAKKAGLEFDNSYIRKISKPDPLGVLHPSRKGIYCARGKHVRPVGVLGKTHESIHSSVKKRWDGKKKYRPVNIKEYLKKRHPGWGK